MAGITTEPEALSLRMSAREARAHLDLVNLDSERPENIAQQLAWARLALDTHLHRLDGLVEEVSGASVRSAGGAHEH